MVNILRFVTSLYRFHTLQIVKWFYKNFGSGEMIKTRLFEGFLMLDPKRTDTHKLLSVLGERFVDERRLIKQLVREGDVVIDAGANIGYYLLMIEKYIGKTGKVICIEPEKANFNELTKCIKDNKFLNVDAIPFAVGAMEGSVILREGLNGVVEKSGVNGVSVGMISIDSLINYKPSFIKIDIEGFEGQALKGMEKTMKEVKPNIFVEVHPSFLIYGISEAEIISIISKYYSKIDFYPVRMDTGILNKVISRYFTTANPCFDNFEKLREYYSVKNIKDPYWIVARR